MRIVLSLGGLSMPIIIQVCVARVWAGIMLLWNLILSQWTGLYKLGCNGFSWHSIQKSSTMVELKNVSDNSSSVNRSKALAKLANIACQTLLFVSMSLALDNQSTLLLGLKQ